MRRICEVAFPVLCLACTPTGPEPKEAAPAEAKAAPAVEPAEVPEELEEPEQPKEPEQLQQPQPPIDTTSSPIFEVVVREPEGEMDWDCTHQIVSHGFPAASEDGTALVEIQGVFEMPCMDLTWYEAEKDRVTRICNEEAPTQEHPDIPPPDCEDHLADAHKRVAKLNAELSTKTWRRLEPLKALFSQPGPALEADWFGIDPWSTLDIDDVLDSIPGADRPLEIYYAKGHFIARVKGVKVLQDQPRPEWQKQDNNEGGNNEDEEDPCTSPSPQIFAVQFDRATSLALVYYHYNAVEGTCDDFGEYASRIQLNPDVLLEAEKRSNEKFMAALQTAVAKGEAGEY